MKIRQANSLTGNSTNDKNERANVTKYNAELGQKKDLKRKTEKNLQDEVKMKKAEDASLVALEQELAILVGILSKLGDGRATPSSSQTLDVSELQQGQV